MISTVIVLLGKSVEAGSTGTFEKADRPVKGEKFPEIFLAGFAARAVDWGTVALDGIKEKKLRSARGEEGGGSNCLHACRHFPSF